MLPNVDTDDRDVGEEGILVGSSDDLDALVGGVVALRSLISISSCTYKIERRTYDPAPTRALDTGGGGVELLLEVVEGAEGREDRRLEGSVLQDTAVTLALGGGGREVLPEERVVDVS